jgi:cytoskeleton protein RodZ
MMSKEMNENGNNSGNVGLLGDYLKQKRTEKNYSLEKLSQKTKISVNILKGLEANDYDHLPSAAYIKGFVTSYVKVLGLPLDEAINKMEYTHLNILGKPFPVLNHTKSMLPNERTASTGHGKDGTENAHEVIESGDSIIENTKSMLPIIIFAAVILIFVGGYKLVSSIVQSEVNGQQTKDLGPKIESSSALVNPNLQKVTPKKDAVQEPKIEAKSTASADSAQTEPVATTTPEPTFQRNFPNVEFSKAQGKLFSVKREAQENEDVTVLPDQIKDAMNPELQNIYIKAIEGNTWLSYKIDEKPIESAIINKGSDLFLQGSEIRIFLGNVNVTKIFYNNYLIETPSKSGVKTLIFPEESMPKYLVPLFPKAKDDVLYTAEDYMKRMKLEEEELEKRQKVLQ